MGKRSKAGRRAWERYRKATFRWLYLALFVCFLWPFLVLNTQAKFTLPLALATFTSEYITDYASTMAGAAISVFPVLIVFLLLQRHFVSGVAMTGIK